MAEAEPSVTASRASLAGHDAQMLANDDPRLRSYWHPVCRSGALDDGPLAARLLGEDLVLARSNSGTLSALPDRCPHRWARLSDGCMIGEELQCPYHGWRFAADGTCTLVPALGPDATVPPRAHLNSLAVREAYDMIWVALAEPTAELIDIPEWGEPDIVAAWLPTVTINCGAAQFIDNFLDIAHFPYVHAATFGVDEPSSDAAGTVATAAMEPYAVETSEDASSIRFRYDHFIANREDPLVDSGEHELIQQRSMDYVYQVPFAARLRLDMPVTGVENTVIVVLAPVDAENSLLFSALLRNDLTGPGDPRAAEAVDFELRVLAEDLIILERFGDPQFPLDTQLQVHTRADRSAIEFRRLLAAHLDRPIDPTRRIAPTPPPDRRPHLTDAPT